MNFKIFLLCLLVPVVVLAQPTTFNLYVTIHIPVPGYEDLKVFGEAFFNMPESQGIITGEVHIISPQEDRSQIYDGYTDGTNVKVTYDTYIRKESFPPSLGIKENVPCTVKMKGTLCSWGSFGDVEVVIKSTHPLLKDKIVYGEYSAEYK